MTGHLKPGKKKALLRAIENCTLGKGSIAGGEYIRNMRQARLCRNSRQQPDKLENLDVRWVEVCYCPTPLMEEIPYWEEYFHLTDIRDAHGRHNCRHENGEELWACSTCDCTQNLEEKMEEWGEKFSDRLKR